MRIATLNIDWAKSNKEEIEKLLNHLDFDILILTETLENLNLSNYQYIYHTKPIPLDREFENLDYSFFVKKGKPVRVSIYSKFKSIQSYEVSDVYTSICKEFETEIGNITLYATIIGTQFNKKPFAENELNNCKNDCLKIHKKTNNLCLVGDLNTSFISAESYYEIKYLQSRKKIINICNDCEIDLTTKQIKFNIDHILLAKSIASKYNITKNIFIAKGILSDHQGIYIDIDETKA